MTESLVTESASNIENLSVQFISSLDLGVYTVEYKASFTESPTDSLATYPTYSFQVTIAPYVDTIVPPVPLSSPVFYEISDALV